MLLLDSDVLIDYLRGFSPAVNYFETLGDATAISVVSVTEIFSGARNQNEEAAMNDLFSTMVVIPVDENIAREAGRLRRQFLRSHQVEIADALIAATSILHRLRLVTLNRKHYPMITSLLVPYRKSMSAS
jgi:predicted nucleic acid-binding protein